MRHHKQMGCGTAPQTIVCPTKCNEVHTNSMNVTNYIHPSHTTYVNHHLQKNKHYYPHTTSYQNTFDQVNVYGGPRPPGPFSGSQGPGGQNPFFPPNGFRR